MGVRVVPCWSGIWVLSSWAGFVLLPATEEGRAVAVVLFGFLLAKETHCVVGVEELLFERGDGRGR